MRVTIFQSCDEFNAEYAEFGVGFDILGSRKKLVADGLPVDPFELETGLVLPEVLVQIPKCVFIGDLCGSDPRCSGFADSLVAPLFHALTVLL